MLRLHFPLDTEQTNTLRCAETPVVESVTADACQNPSKYLKQSPLCVAGERRHFIKREQLQNKEATILKCHCLYQLTY